MIDAPQRRDGAGLGSANFPTPAGSPLLGLYSGGEKVWESIGLTSSPPELVQLALTTLEQPRATPEHAEPHYNSLYCIECIVIVHGIVQDRNHFPKLLKSLHGVKPKGKLCSWNHTSLNDTVISMPYPAGNLTVDHFSTRGRTWHGTVDYYFHLGRTRGMAEKPLGMIRRADHFSQHRMHT